MLILYNETGCKAGEKCLFPHYKVDEQPHKKPKKSYFPKRRESDDKSAVAVVKSVSQLIRFSCTRFSRWKVSGKPEHQFKGYDSLLRYVTRVSGKRKDHRWEKINV